MKMRWILPPLLLAALFVCVVVGQTGNARRNQNLLLPTQDESERIADGEAAETVLKIQTDEKHNELNRNRLEEGIEIESQKREKIRLLFAGDIYLSDHVLHAYDRAGGIEGVLDESLRQSIQESDIFMANEEFPFSDRGIPADDKQFTFCLPSSRVSIMKEIGPDIVALANNHALDYGTDALLDTCELLDEAGIKHVGAGASLKEAKQLEVIETGGRKIGFLAASRVIPVSNWAAGLETPGMLITYDPTLLLKEIKSAKEKCDYLIVYVHWGIERNNMPENYQKTLGRQYIDAGADIVVGSHPHVLQGMEYYEGKPIIYSLGNFVFGSSIPQTALLKVELPENQEEAPSITFIPCTSSAGYTKKMNEAKGTSLFQYLEQISFDVSILPDGSVLPREQSEK